MELAQITHLARETPPFAFDDAKATALRRVLSQILVRLEAIAPKVAAGA
jgi:formiminoglutamase